MHRDIKPANIFLVASAKWRVARTDAAAARQDLATHHSSLTARVKILDFGLARDAGAGNITHSGTIVGTPAYKAPEQVEGNVDPRADLFSLGCILYCLATGTAPYPGDTPLSILQSLTVHTPAAVRALNPDLTPAFAELIMRLIARRPEGRPHAAAALLEELDDIEAAGPSAFKRDQRRPWLLGAACVASQPHPRLSPSRPKGTGIPRSQWALAVRLATAFDMASSGRT